MNYKKLYMYIMNSNIYYYVIWFLIFATILLLCVNIMCSNKYSNYSVLDSF